MSPPKNLELQPTNPSQAPTPAQTRLTSIESHLAPPTPQIPLPSPGSHGAKDGTATATCYCSAVQIRVPITPPGLIDTFVCHCTDCRKITASAFASNFIVLASHVTHVRGEDKLTKFTQARTIATGNEMESAFCGVCGTLMWRRSSAFPECLVARIGTVDDFGVQETALKPRVEIFGKDKCAWVEGVDTEVRVDGAYFTGGARWRSSHDGVEGGGKGK